MGGTTLNDINDFEVDKINASYRPLQRGLITFKEAYIFLASCYITGLVLSLFLPFPFSVGAIVFILLSIFYSQVPIAFERRTILGNITLSLVTVLIPGLSGGLVASKNILYHKDFVLAFSFLALLFLFVTLFKDLKDIRGDKLKGKKTFTLYFGPENSRKVGFIGIFLFYPLFLYSFSKILTFRVYFLLFGFFLYVLFLWISRKPFNLEREENRFSKLRMIFLIMIISLFLFI